MNKIIAKILIAVMVLTTVMMPVEFGFADTAQAEQTAKQQMKSEQTAEETVTEEMQFLYLEQQKVEAPGTQNIAISWEEKIDEVTEMFLIYENDKGKQFELRESERTEDSILFAKTFEPNEMGVYVIKGIKYYVSDIENYMSFDDIEIDADFEVVDELTENELEEANQLMAKVEDNIVTIEVEDGNVDNEGV